MGVYISTERKLNRKCKSYDTYVERPQAIYNAGGSQSRFSPSSTRFKGISNYNTELAMKNSGFCFFDNWRNVILRKGIDKGGALAYVILSTMAGKEVTVPENIRDEWELIAPSVESMRQKRKAGDRNAERVASKEEGRQMTKAELSQMFNLPHYTVSEASRVTGVPTGSIYRVMRNYLKKHNQDEGLASAPFDANLLANMYICYYNITVI